MAYVNMTKDFSEVRKTIPGLGITKRQMFAFLSGFAVGVPVFIGMRLVLKQEIIVSLTGLSIAAAPFIILILYKKNGMGAEKYLKYFPMDFLIYNLLAVAVDRKMEIFT